MDIGVVCRILGLAASEITKCKVKNGKGCDPASCLSRGAFFILHFNAA
jgi:hypothetical protein